MTNLLFILSMFFLPVQDIQEVINPVETGIQVNIEYLRADFSGAPTIIVIHDFGGNLERWKQIAHKFRDLGFNVSLFNLRGHADGSTPYFRFSNEKIKDLARDVKGALEATKQRSRGKIFLLGAGLGANLAMKVAHEDQSISKIVAVSPGLTYRGVKLYKEMLDTLSGRLMLVASQEDSYSLNTVELLEKSFEEKPEIKLYSNAGHGVWILKRIPESMASIARWLSAD